MNYKREKPKKSFNPKNPILNNATESSDLLEIANRLDDFLKSIQPISDQSNALEKLEEIYVMQSFLNLIVTEKNSYQILENELSVAQYLYNFLPYRFPPKDSISILNNMVTHIRTNVTTPLRRPIKQTGDSRNHGASRKAFFLLSQGA
jgi:hypothetical protein